MYYIKSEEEDDLYIGLEDEEVRGTKLIGVHRAHAEVWKIKQTGPLNYLYGHQVLSLYPLLSSISFDRIGLKEYPFVMEFPKDNLHPGTQAQLGELFLEEANQIWVINERESYSQDLPRFLSLKRYVE